MENLENLRTKALLVAMCTVEAQLQTIQKGMDQLMEAKTNETKSSAGDKYETGMAMIHNQENLLKRQQLEAQHRMRQLTSIKNYKASSFIKKGSLIKLSTGYFLLGVALGKIEVDHETIYFLSEDSPLGSKLLHKVTGDNVIINDQMIKILSVV